MAFLELSFDCYKDKNMRKTLNIQFHEYLDSKNSNIQKRANINKKLQATRNDIPPRPSEVNQRNQRRGGTADSNQTYDKPNSKHPIQLNPTQPRGRNDRKAPPTPLTSVSASRRRCALPPSIPSSLFTRAQRTAPFQHLPQAYVQDDCHQCHRL